MPVVAPTPASPSPHRGTLSKSKLTGLDFPAGLHAAAQRRLRRPPAPPCASSPPMIARHREKLSRPDLRICIESPRSDWLSQLPPPSPLLPSPALPSGGLFIWRRQGSGDARSVPEGNREVDALLLIHLIFSPFRNILGFFFSTINGKVPGRTSGVYTSRQRHPGPVRGKDDLKPVCRQTLRF